jgi:hypothetical protein
MSTAQEHCTDALDLGWRLAALYAQRPDAAAPDGGSAGYLPAVDNLAESDRLELYLRAAASIARRMGAAACGDEIEALVALAREHPRRPDAVAVLRDRLRACHTTMTKDLWAARESDGKAFELGTSLFDTWYRVASPGEQGLAPALRDVFGPARVERVKLLLDDLEALLPSVAVTVVRAHLDRWKALMEQRPHRATRFPPDTLWRLYSQVVTWRQLLTGAKEPEAFLTARDRGRLHREYSWLIWRSFLRPAPIACLAVIAGLAAALMFGGPQVTDAARLVIAPLGAIGLSKASFAVLARDRFHTWSMLVWNRAVAGVLFRATCQAEAVLGPVYCGRLPRARRAAAAVTRPLPRLAAETGPAPEL